MSTQKELLKIKDLKVHFPVYGGVFSRKVNEVKAVDGPETKGCSVWCLHIHLSVSVILRFSQEPAIDVRVVIKGCE